jgi:Uma2 family endonuclease
MKSATELQRDTAPEAPMDARFTWDADRYEAAVAAGVFTSEDPIELIDGEIIKHMAPQKSLHMTGITLAQEALRTAFGAGFVIRVQGPLRLGLDSLPEPDVAVVRGAPRDFIEGHPRTADLVVEVSDSTLRLDRGRKLRLYARAGIPEYWLVNLSDACVEVFRQPRGQDYAEKRTCRRGEMIATGPAGAPVAVADLLP